VMDAGSSRAGLTMTTRTEMASNEAQLTIKVATGRRKAHVLTVGRFNDLRDFPVEGVGACDAETMGNRRSMEDIVRMAKLHASTAPETMRRDGVQPNP